MNLAEIQDLIGKGRYELSEHAQRGGSMTISM
jgi:hypothetical protein